MFLPSKAIPIKCFVSHRPSLVMVCPSVGKKKEKRMNTFTFVY